MDVLVVMGTTAAYLYSWYLLLTLGSAADGQLYFEASAVIITLVPARQALGEPGQASNHQRHSPTDGSASGDGRAFVGRTVPRRSSP